MQVQGNPVNLKGEQTGKIKIDLSTGMVSYSESEFKAKGKIFVLDNEVPIKIETKTKIKGEKIR